jgi:hypothetical protein
MLRYSQQLISKTDDSISVTIGQGYIQADIQYYFVCFNSPVGCITQSRLMREDEIMQQFKEKK